VATATSDGVQVIEILSEKKNEAQMYILQNCPTTGQKALLI